MLKPPSELLDSWLERIPIGHALDLGAGDGEATLWLVESGFRVEAVERDPEACSRLKEACRGLDVVIHPNDVLDFGFPQEKYSLILASAILHFIRPTDLWSLAGRIIAALENGGFLIAEVLTTDDPGYDVLRDSRAEQIEPNTFMMPSADNVIHYFAPDELRRTFSTLEEVFYEETRRRDVEDTIGFRAGASLIARRKAKG